MNTSEGEDWIETDVSKRNLIKESSDDDESSEEIEAPSKSPEAAQVKEVPIWQQNDKLGPNYKRLEFTAVGLDEIYKLDKVISDTLWMLTDNLTKQIVVKQVQIVDNSLVPQEPKKVVSFIVEAYNELPTLDQITILGTTSIIVYEYEAVQQNVAIQETENYAETFLQNVASRRWKCLVQPLITNKMKASILVKATEQKGTYSLITGELVLEEALAPVVLDFRHIIAAFPGYVHLAKYTSENTWKIFNEPTLSSNFIAGIVHVKSKRIGYFDLKTSLIKWSTELYVDQTHASHPGMLTDETGPAPPIHSNVKPSQKVKKIKGTKVTPPANKKVKPEKAENLSTKATTGKGKKVFTKKLTDGAAAADDAAASNANQACKVLTKKEKKLLFHADDVILKPFRYVTTMHLAGIKTNYRVHYI